MPRDRSPSSASFRALLTGTCWALVVVLGASGAGAESACPSRDAVEDAVAELASHEPSAPHFDEQARSSLTLEDRGQSFRVTIAARTRDYADPERDCERRARLAAVYIALVLTGEQAEATAPEGEAKPREPPPAAPPPPPPTEPTPTRATLRDSRFGLDVGARLAFAPSAAGLVVLPGAELGGSFTPGSFGARLAVALPFASGTLAVGPASAHLARYPLALTARYRFRFEPFLGALDAGLETALLRVSRADGSAPSTRVDFGARGGLWVGLAGSRLSPFVSALVEVVPVRFPLALEPDGVVAETPLLWLGATAGVAFAF